MPNSYEDERKVSRDEATKSAANKDGDEEKGTTTTTTTTTSKVFNEDDMDSMLMFPSHPGFTIPVVIQSTPELGPNQYGVFAAEDIPPHTKFWVWTDLVQEIPAAEIAAYIEEHFFNTSSKDNIHSQNNDDNDDDNNDNTTTDMTIREQIQQFLRRGFVLPSPYDDYFYSNPDDAGTFMNHSSTPNCVRPHGTARWIRKGEELTMDYSENGNPDWYVDLCHSYGILTAVEIAQRSQLETEKHPVDSPPPTNTPAVYTGPVQSKLLEKMIPF